MWKRLDHPHIQSLLGLHWGLSDLPALVSEWQANGDITAYLKEKRTEPKIQDMKFSLVSRILQVLWTVLSQCTLAHTGYRWARLLCAQFKFKTCF